MNYKKAAAALCAAAVIGTGVGASFAYLTAKDDATNTFNVSAVETKITEDFTPPDEVKPGTVIKKSPKVVSTGSDVDCYVRMKVTFTNDMEKMCEYTINSGWTKKADGYYYWEGKLAPGESTGTLFDTVTIKSSAKEEDIVPFDINVYEESVQCGDLTADAAWAAMD